MGLGSTQCWRCKLSDCLWRLCDALERTGWRVARLARHASCGSRHTGPQWNTGPVSHDVSWDDDLRVGVGFPLR
jgi:hypothetical protein